MGLESFIKGRIGLWLRSERAMGLSLLPLHQPLPVVAPVAAAAAPVMASRAAPRATPVRAAAPARAASTPVSSPAPSAAAAAAAKPAPLGPDGGAPFAGPAPGREEKLRLLAELNEKQVRICSRCRLAETRRQTVFGEGDVDAAIFFIGEGPGDTEDRTGRPFVGRAGQKLDEMISAMGLKREQVYIANIVKCRAFLPGPPPKDRAPVAEEVESCSPYLVKQLEIIRPKVIVTLGLPATRYITKSNLSMTQMRGQWASYRGIRVMPTFHPAYILRNYTMETRRAVWSDLQKVMGELGLAPARRGGGDS